MNGRRPDSTKKRHTVRVLLETGRPDGENARSLVFSRPLDILRLDAGDDVPFFFERVNSALEAGRWLAGYAAYEFGYAIEPKLHRLLEGRSSDGPLVWFGVFEAPLVVDVDAGRDPLELWGGGTVGTNAIQIPGAFEMGEPTLDIDRTAYRRVIGRIHRSIRNGETYQVNFTTRYRFAFEGDVAAFYRALRDRQRVPYAALIDDGESYIVSLSPELFFRRRGGRIVTRPMKGTAGRGGNATDDQKLAEWLRLDPKNRAENVMIVDMIRNDLGRVASPGDVRVTSLFDVDRFETLHQMTSTVEADVPRDTSCAELFSALFPCASVTGAPKIQTMQMIAELEDAPRGVYTGAVGYVEPNGDACFSVAIRTAVVRADGEGILGIGSGVVIDSDRDDEFDECALKGEFLVEAAASFQLIETMAASNEGVAMVDEHLSRLERSAEYFGFECPSMEIRADLVSRAERAIRGDGGERVTPAPRGPRIKLRLLLGRNGAYEIECAALDRPSRPWRVVISPNPVRSTDVWLRHKTTRRGFYDRERRLALEAGYDEVVFANERGELTEGAITNIFFQRGGALVTPPTESGALPGVLRSVLMREGACVETILRPADFRVPGRVFVGNSVVGLVEVANVGPQRWGDER